MDKEKLTTKNEHDEALKELEKKVKAELDSLLTTKDKKISNLSKDIKDLQLKLDGLLY